MNRTQKILLIVIGVLVLVLVLLLIFSRPKGGQPVNVPVNQAATNQPTGLPVNVNSSLNANVAVNANAAPQPEPVDQSNNLRRVAAAFAERYGSFSNAGNYQNLVDLEPFMTSSFAAETQAYVDAQRATPPSAEYSGTTTRSISVSVDALDDAAGAATLTVSTQRHAEGSTPNSEQVYYQSLTLTFAKQGSAWLVSDATWQPR